MCKIWLGSFLLLHALSAAKTVITQNAETELDPLVNINNQQIFLDVIQHNAFAKSVDLLDTTASPTEQPVTPPSEQPTYIPSAMPTTGLPSAAPSFVPTRAPSTSSAPSFAPSQQSRPIVSFTSSVTLSGVTASTLDGDTAAQQSVSAATCTSMSLSTSDCTYVSSTLASSLRRMLSTQTYTVVANVQTSTVVPTGSSASTYGSSLVSTLSTAVTQGTFKSNLVTASNTYGSGVTANATATSVTSTTPTVTDAPSSNKNKVLSNGAIAGIVIGGVVFIAIVAFLLYYFCCRTYDEYVPSSAFVDRRGQTPSDSALVQRSKEEIVIALLCLTCRRPTYLRCRISCPGCAQCEEL